MKTSTQTILAAVAAAVIAEGVRRLLEDDQPAGPDDIKSARTTVEYTTRTLGDDFVTAIALTGYGAPEGPTVAFSGGSERLLRHIKLGYVLDAENGTVTRTAGDNARPVRPDDFYSPAVMTQVAKYLGNLDMFQACAEYTGAKITVADDIYRLWESIHALDTDEATKMEIAHAIYEASNHQGIGKMLPTFDSFANVGAAIFVG